MALTLLEQSKLYSSEIMKTSIMEEFARDSDLLRVLPFEDIAGNAVTFNREYTLPGAAERAVNEGYTESTGTLEPQTVSLKLMGGDLDVDRFLISTGSAGVRASQELMKAKAVAHRWTKNFFKGDSTVNNGRTFSGLQQRLSGDQVIDNGSTSGGDALDLNKLDEAIDAVDNPTHICMNKAVRRRMTSAQRDNTIGGYITFDRNEFGMRIERYADLEIVIVDYDELGNQILPFTEANPGGGEPASTSVYVLSLGQNRVSGIQSSGGMSVRDLGEIDTAPVFRTRIEWYSNFAVFQARSAARLRGIKNAAITNS